VLHGLPTICIKKIFGEREKSAFDVTMVILKEKILGKLWGRKKNNKERICWGRRNCVPIYSQMI